MVMDRNGMSHKAAGTVGGGRFAKARRVPGRMMT